MAQSMNFALWALNAAGTGGFSPLVSTSFLYILIGSSGDAEIPLSEDTGPDR